MNDFFFRTEERGGGWAGGGGVRSQTYFEGRHRTLGGGDDASKLPFSVTYKWEASAARSKIQSYPKKSDLLLVSRLLLARLTRPMCRCISPAVVLLPPFEKKLALDNAHVKSSAIFLFCTDYGASTIFVV